MDPQNGSIEPYQSTLGGAEIFFMCNPRFVPAGRMRANCTSNGVAVNGTWTPDPANHMCNGEIIQLTNVKCIASNTQAVDTNRKFIVV